MAKRLQRRIVVLYGCRAGRTTTTLALIPPGGGNFTLAHAITVSGDPLLTYRSAQLSPSSSPITGAGHVEKTGTAH
jgi:hypothetical protein